MTRTLILLLVLSSAASAHGQTASPTPLSGNPQPVYPAVARQDTIEGSVEFYAIVNSDGAVESVTVTRVPREGAGFERAVEETVKKWRFQPAMQGTTAVVSTYAGSIRFALSIPGEWIFPVPSKVAGAAIQKVADDLDLRVETKDQDHQFLLTQFLTYRGRPLPDVEALALQLGNIPDKIQFQFYVSPGLEPARVAIGTIIQTTAISTNGRREATAYGRDAVRVWFLSRRAEQTARLLPAGTAEPCGTRPASILPAKSSQLVTAPKAFHRVRPVYPKELLDSRKGGSIVFEAEVTEHGTLTGIRHRSPADAPTDFKLASQLAAGLWRFEPGKSGTCPTRVRATLAMSFVTR